MRAAGQIAVEHWFHWFLLNVEAHLLCIFLIIIIFYQCTTAVMTTENQQLGIPYTTAILRAANFINVLEGEDEEGLEIKNVCKHVKLKIFKY